MEEQDTETQPVHPIQVWCLNFLFSVYFPVIFLLVAIEKYEKTISIGWMSGQYASFSQGYQGISPR